ncbi:hypothetical protein GCM10009834_25770 [Streptomonospora arabica]
MLAFLDRPFVFERPDELRDPVGAPADPDSRGRAAGRPARRRYRVRVNASLPIPGPADHGG